MLEQAAAMMRNGIRSWKSAGLRNINEPWFPRKDVLLETIVSLVFHDILIRASDVTMSTQQNNRISLSVTGQEGVAINLLLTREGLEAAGSLTVEGNRG